jgi:hypothetical protein
MATIEETKVPMKGSIIINPKTSRPVKVGSRVWLKLVKDGIVEGKYTDPNEICEVKEGDDEKELIRQSNENLPSTQQAVRGRGKYANKIVIRNKNPSTRETTQHTVRTTARKLKDPAVYEQLRESDDFETELEKLIMEELAGIVNEPVKVKRNVVKRNQVGEEKYYTQEPEQDYEEESEDDYDDFGGHTVADRYYE